MQDAMTKCLSGALVRLQAGRKLVGQEVLGLSW